MDMDDREIKLTENALKVLERRYLARDSEGRVAETPEGLFRRVARCVAAVDRKHDPAVNIEEMEEAYFQVMASSSFLPNSPTLMNAGNPGGQLSACFVIPVEDSIAGIFGALSTMARIHQTGGGTGFSFSRLRPKDDVVGQTGGVASGPVSFMRVFDQATDVVKQGGRRRGANMGILRVDHPDILEFIAAKESPGEFVNFNLSVSVTDRFMDALAHGGGYDLVNPRNGAVTGRLQAMDVWEKMASAAWSSGDPGVVFIDRVNATQPTPAAGTIEATNPCGEQPLLPYESCNLGSINLKNVVADGVVDWDRLRALVHDGVRFLDNVIDANTYPLPEIAAATLANRKIGLGVMGFAEMLIMMGIPYDSEDAVRTAERVMSFISKEAEAASAELGKVRGSFPNFGRSIWKGRGFDAMRNATVTTVAPTGTIGIIAGASSGIEPLFAVAFVRRVMEGVELMEVNQLFVERAARDGFYSDKLMEAVAARGSLLDVEGVPDDVKRLFVTALDISPDWHVRIQAAFQAHTGNAVSKTINLPHSATTADIARIYQLAYDLGCKGITVFRYGSRQGQVLSVEPRPAIGYDEGRLKADTEYAGECRICSI